MLSSLVNSVYATTSSPPAELALTPRFGNKDPDRSPSPESSPKSPLDAPASPRSPSATLSTNHQPLLPSSTSVLLIPASKPDDEHDLHEHNNNNIMTPRRNSSPTVVLSPPSWTRPSWADDNPDDNFDSGSGKRSDPNDFSALSPKALFSPCASPFAPPTVTNLDGSNVENDIRIMLATGTNAPVEVLRNQVVTSMTLGVKPESFTVNSSGVTRKLVLGNKSNSAQDLAGLDADDPSDYRQLIMRLSDMQYVCIKAVADVGADGTVDEREYWLPLERSQTVGDLKRLITGADGLEAPGDKLLSDVVRSEDGMALALHGRPLQDDNKTLQEVGLEHNTVVHLFVKKDANITVKMVGGTGNGQMEVRVDAGETAESLRKKLAALKPATQQQKAQLYYGGHPLRDGPLSDYGVTDGATLELRPYGPPSSLSSRSMYGSYHGTGFQHPGSFSPDKSVASHNSGGGGGSSYGGAAGSFGGGGAIPIPMSRGSSRRTSWSPHHHQPGAGGASLSSMMSFGIDGGSGGSSDPPSPYTPPVGSPEYLAQSFDRAREGLASGKAPVLSRGGTGGAYFLRDTAGEACAVFKPADEEPCARNNPRGRAVSETGEGLRKGTRVGEGAAREVAAYLLDHQGFAGVPATSLASLCEMRRSASGNIDGKLGSLQAYVRADAEAEEYGPSLFPTDQVHKITQLDIRLANTDRNAGNILVQMHNHGAGNVTGNPASPPKIPTTRDGASAMTLVPIDHGYALPHTLEDVCFEWEFWPQARVPYNDETKAYIAAIDVAADVEMLRENGIELQPSSERVLRVCTTLLQKAAACGCCPADIASMMSRASPNRMSDLEKMTARAAAAAIAAVRAEDGLIMKPQPAAGSFWADLDDDARAERKFDAEMESLLDSYLEGFEGQSGPGGAPPGFSDDDEE